MFRQVSQQIYVNNNGDEKKLAMQYNNIDDELKVYEYNNGKVKNIVEKDFSKMYKSKMYKTKSKKYKTKKYKTKRNKTKQTKQIKKKKSKKSKTKLINSHQYES